jgi:hypothetical protein
MKLCHFMPSIIVKAVFDSRRGCNFVCCCLLQRCCCITETLRGTLGEFYSLIKKLGLNPKTVKDVGVAGGTPELYTNLPNDLIC